LVQGRLGELVDYASPLTFSLLEKIYERNGPVRKVFENFGIPVKDVQASYLVNLNGKVYTNLELENQVLWADLPWKFRDYGGEVKSVRDWLPGTPRKLKNLIYKSLTETFILARLSHSLIKAKKRYRAFGEFTLTVSESGECTTQSFLKAYEHVCYVSYLYGLTLKFFEGKCDVGSKQWKNYVSDNDCLAGNQNCLESEFLHKSSFELENCVIDSKWEGKVKKEKTTHIPLRLPDTYGIKGEGCSAVIQLQCMKNNMRLMTHVLLYYLSATLKNKAKALDLAQEFPYLTVDEIEKSSTEDGKELAKTAKSRRQSYRKIVHGDFSPTHAPAHTKLKGRPCSPGTIKGRVQIINDPKEEVKEEIVCVPNASLSYVRQYKDARGLIFLSGSLLSHGAIVAREMGTPAVILKVGPKEIEGKMVELEGTTGEVAILNGGH